MQEKQKRLAQNRPICPGTAGDAKISQEKPWKPQRAIVSISKPLAAVAAELQCHLASLPSQHVFETQRARLSQGGKSRFGPGGGEREQANQSPELFRVTKNFVDVIPTNGRAQHPTPAEARRAPTEDERGVRNGGPWLGSAVGLALPCPRGSGRLVAPSLRQWFFPLMGSILFTLSIIPD